MHISSKVTCTEIILHLCPSTIFWRRLIVTSIYNALLICLQETTHYCRLNYKICCILQNAELLDTIIGGFSNSKCLFQNDLFYRFLVAIELQALRVEPIIFNRKSIHQKTIRTSSCYSLFMFHKRTSWWHSNNFMAYHLVSDGWLSIALSITITDPGKKVNEALAEEKCPYGWLTGMHHYGDIIMGAIASQITSLTIVYATVYSDADQRKRQSSVSLAFVWGSHRGPLTSPHTWPATRKMFPFEDVIMMLNENIW